MLDPKHIESLFRDLKVPEAGRHYVERVRASPPSRRVESRVGNVVGRFPSRKMGFVISTESRHGELALAYQLEFDDTVLEFYPQPEPIKLSYIARFGRQTGGMHTPDFLVVARDGIRFVEVKTEEGLQRLATEQPHRYQQRKDGSWWCPPGVEAASRLGLGYEVANSTRFNRTLIRNLEYLRDYQGASVGSLAVDLQAIVEAESGITLDRVQCQLGVGRMDDVLAAIATGRLYADLEAADLRVCESVRIWPSRELAKAVRSARPEVPAVVREPAGQESHEGQPGIPGETPSAQAELAPPANSVVAILKKASPEDLRVAHERDALLKDPDLARKRSIPARTLRRWRAKYRQAELRHGSGFIGLLPDYSRQGNRSERLAAPVYALADAVIDEVYMTPKRVSKTYAYGVFVQRCREAHLPAPSRVWFSRFIRRRKLAEVKRAREGARAAYSAELGEHRATVPGDNHGKYPWEVVHIDHTQVDLELLDEQTCTALGRPWLTLMFDGFSRQVLAFVLTFDAPSVNSLRLLLRDCVRRHRRLPSGLVLDWGKEFGSGFFETITAMYGIQILKRPPHRARFGSVIEREFGTLNEAFLHNLSGNTQNTRNVRQLTKSMDPKRHAAWTLTSLGGLLDRFIAEVHQHRLHPELGTTPAKAYERGVEIHGLRPSRHVEDPEAFRFLTMASTPKGTARIQPGLGVKIRYFYYWSDEMRDPELEKTEVPVCYDPDDLGVAFARLRHRWVQCVCGHSHALRGKTEKQVTLAVQAVRRRRSVVEAGRSVTAAQIATFLGSAESEAVLRSQQMRDLARSATVQARDVAKVNAANQTLGDPDEQTPAVPVRQQERAAASRTESLEVFGDF